MKPYSGIWPVAPTAFNDDGTLAAFVCLGPRLQHGQRAHVHGTARPFHGEEGLVLTGHSGAAV